MPRPARGRGEEAPMAVAAAAAAAQEQTRPIRCIIKLGGAAITNKGELESIDAVSLRSACAQLRQAMSHGGAAGKVVGMDWSRRPGDPTDPVVDVEGLSEMEGLGLDSNFVVVHGAGPELEQIGGGTPHIMGLLVTSKQVDQESIKEGFIQHLLRLALWLQEFQSLLSTRKLLELLQELASANASQITESLNVGFVPVLHGDAVLDELLDCTILSGDVIIRHLAQLLRPKYVVFLTDVHGVYDRPPTDPNAELLREIEVDDNGSWSIVKPALQGNKKGVEISVAAHDTTGGMETKILEAAAIARLGVDVYITKVGTEHSLRALKGDTSSEDWLGTVIRSSK